jgi:hypothetical protein
MGGIIMSTIKYDGTMVFGNTLGGSVTIAPKNNTSTNYTLTIPDISGTLSLIDSPAFTGIPTAPTATVGTNTTQLATTAMVHSAITNDLNVTGTAPMYACRAWVNYNGSSPSIRASGNVSSVTKNGTGDYTINFTTAMTDANYSFAMGYSYGVIGSLSQSDNVLHTNYFRTIMGNAAIPNADVTYVTLQIFR